MTATKKSRRWLLGWRTFAIVSLLITVITYLGWGSNAAAGFLLGLLGIGGDILALWVLVLSLGSAAKEGAQPRFGPAMTILALIVKFPLVFATMWLCWKLGSAAFYGYLAGIALVYSRLIGQILPLD